MNQFIAGNWYPFSPSLRTRSKLSKAIELASAICSTRIEEAEGPNRICCSTARNPSFCRSIWRHTLRAEGALTMYTDEVCCCIPIFFRRQAAMLEHSSTTESCSWLKCLPKRSKSQGQRLLVGLRWWRIVSGCCAS